MRSCLFGAINLDLGARLPFPLLLDSHQLASRHICSEGQNQTSHWRPDGLRSASQTLAAQFGVQ